MKAEWKTEVEELVPGPGLLRGEGWDLRATEQINYRDNERTISQRTFQSPGERLRFTVRRLRTRVRSIGFSHTIESRLRHIPISLLRPFVRIQQLKAERLNTLQTGNVCDPED
jgi:hypothetical protein